MKELKFKIKTTLIDNKEVSEYECTAESFYCLLPRLVLETENNPSRAVMRVRDCSDKLIATLLNFPGERIHTTIQLTTQE